jgi:hypothetical protein
MVFAAGQIGVFIACRGIVMQNDDREKTVKPARLFYNWHKIKSGSSAS